MSGRLSPEQIEFFRREGYLIYDQPVLEPQEFADLKAHFETKLSTWAQDSGGQSPEAMDVPHFTDPALFRWLFSPRILDIVESLIGPDIALWSSHFIAKPAGVGKRVPWHEDSAYWGQVLDPMEVVTVWLAVDPSNTQNGCMRVIPGTHHNGYSEYEAVENAAANVFATEMKAGQFDESQAVDFVLQPNHGSIHHAKVVHGSNANTSAMRRCGYTMRYVPATSKYRPQQGFEAFQIYLARGENKADNSYGDPTRQNENWINAGKRARLLAKQLAG